MLNFKNFISLLSLSITFLWLLPLQAYEIDPRYKQQNWTFKKCGESKLVVQVGVTFDPRDCRESINEAGLRYLDERGYRMRSCEALGGVLSCSQTRRTRDANGRFSCEKRLSQRGDTYYSHSISSWCTCVCPGQVQPLFGKAESSIPLVARSEESCKGAIASVKKDLSHLSNDLNVYRNDSLNFRFFSASPYLSNQCSRDEYGNYVASGTLKVAAQVNRLLINQKITHPNQPIDLESNDSRTPVLIRNPILPIVLR